jgi:hypothetical protein
LWRNNQVLVFDNFLSPDEVEALKARGAGEGFEASVKVLPSSKFFCFLNFLNMLASNCMFPFLGHLFQLFSITFLVAPSCLLLGGRGQTLTGRQVRSHQVDRSHLGDRLVGGLVEKEGGKKRAP